MRIGKYILLGVVFAWTLWFVFAGFGNVQDPLYWLYKYEHMQGGWMACGTILTGGVIVRLFGASLLPLRLFGWACVVTAILLPYCRLLDKSQQREHLHWLALTFILMGYGAFQEFSPGTLSVLLLSALWVTQSPVVLGLAVAARFPNILALLVLIPLWKKRSLWNIPVASLTAGIVYGLAYLFVTPAVTDTAMTSHDLGAMVTKLWEKGGLLAGYVLMSVAVLAIGKTSIGSQKSPLYHRLISVIKPLIVGLVLIYMVLYTTKPQQWYNIDLTYFISALCIVTALGKSSVARPQLLIGTMILGVATLGTDTAWLKLFPAVLCLLPVSASYYEPAERRYLWIVLAVVSTVVMMRFATNSVGKCDLTQATIVCSVAPYQHIAMQEKENEWLQQVKSDINGDTTVLVLGQRMHLIRAVTGCRAGVYNEFWSNIFDSVYTAKYQRVIRESHPVVVCSFTPQYKTKPAYTDKHSALEQMLVDEGYQVIDRSEWEYMIYKWTDD